MGSTFKVVGDANLGKLTTLNSTDILWIMRSPYNTINNDGYIEWGDIVAHFGGRTYAGTSDPGVNEDGTAGYAVGSIGVNTTTGDAFVCVDTTTGAAVWNAL